MPNRHSLLKWCIDHEFELIELEVDDPHSSEESEDNESNGIERIFEALSANRWPKMNLKGFITHRFSNISTYGFFLRTSHLSAI